ncbi:MAG: small basic family protein [Alkaliphilus sp.]
MLIALIGLIIGIILGFYLPVVYPVAFSLYISIAILAAFDSVFGALKASLEKKFDTIVFVSGFFGNAILAGGLAYIGDRMGIPLYYAAIFAFGNRLFTNFAIIRRHLLKIKTE